MAELIIQKRKTRRGGQGSAGSSAAYLPTGVGGVGAGVSSHTELLDVYTTESELNKADVVHLSVEDAKELLALLGITDVKEGQELDVLGKLKASYAEFQQSKLGASEADSIRIAEGIGSKDFAPGTFGWQGNARGDFEMNSLKLREALEVPILKYNKITYLSGEEWRTWGGGTIKEVSITNEAQGIITVQVEEGDGHTLVKDDTCKAIFHHDTGFYTVYFLVTQVIDHERFAYALRQGYTKHPRKGVDFAQIGNLTDAKRQGGRRDTPRNSVLYDQLNGWDIKPEMVRGINGDLSEFKIGDYGQLEGYGTFSGNAYIQGVIRQIRPNEPVPSPIPYNMGKWQDGSVAYYYDLYQHGGSSWLCVDKTATASNPCTTAPSVDSPKWQIYASQGLQGYPAIHLVVDNTNGTVFHNNQGSTTLVAVVRVGADDYTPLLADNLFSWVRKTRYPENDEVWNQAHVAHGKRLDVTAADVYGRAHYDFIIDLNEVKKLIKL